MQPTEKSTEFWLCFGLLLVLGGWTRFKEVDQPAWVCWDETHFGKMGSWYINRTFFFDVHPPLGKMIIGGVGYLTGYNGTFAFEKPGDLYHDHNYLGMRLACTFLGACLIPFSFLTVWEFTQSVNAAFFAGILIVFGKSFLSRKKFVKLKEGLHCLARMSTNFHEFFSSRQLQIFFSLNSCLFQILEC